MTLNEKINKWIEECKSINKPHDLLLWKSKVMGDNSEMYVRLKSVKGMTLEQKKTEGKWLNEMANRLSEEFKSRMAFLKASITPQIDITLPFYSSVGSRHPVTQTIEEIKGILIQMGFEFFSCPEIETPFRCFTGLNVPDNHPCKTDHQSFYLEGGKILRSHCTTMDTYLLESQTFPINSFTIGRTFRCDNDRTHTPMFHQVDILSVSKEANVKSLIATIKMFLYHIFHEELPIRLRPSFFPFTEPSYEVDMLFKGQWLEILGCGMIHPNVYQLNNSLLPFGAFALGAGIERIIMIRSQLDDIRKLYY